MRVPIVAMAGHAMAVDQKKCLAAGTDDYIARPISRHALGRPGDSNGEAAATSSAAAWRTRAG